ncbi:MAG: hypothetical protein IJ464_02115 [Alistipes sp.]|nr:hypothetical protein [Alistipes sp.]
MKRLLYIAISILPLLALTSCSTAEVERRLDLAESLMAERPDSSYVILRDIDIDDVCSRGVRARYAILLTQAQDKNYIDETDITLISEAKEYYEDSDDVRQRFLSYFYYGRVLSNNGDFTHAIIAYTQAEDMIAELNDNYLAGLLYTEIGNIYRTYYDYDKCLEAYKSAHHYYSNAKLQVHMTYSILNIGIAHWNKDEIQLAEQHIYHAIEMATNLEDEYLKRICYENLVILYNNAGNIDSCKLIVDILNSQYNDKSLSPKCLAAIASYYSDTHQITNAEKYLRTAWNCAIDETDSLSLFFQSANIMKQLGQTDDALYYFENGIKLQNEQVQQAIQQPIVSAQKDYFRNQAAFNAYRLARDRHVYIILSVIVLLIVVVVAMHIRHRIVAKDMEINKYIDLATELQAAIHEKDNRLSEIIVRAEVDNTRLHEMSDQIAELFHKQYELLDKLSNTYYETHGFSLEKDSIYEQVRREINRFTNDKRSIEELENIVNKYKRNVLCLVRNDIPNISDRDIKLLCYIYAGFSAKSISIFIGETTGNILTRKYRLRNKILKLNTPNAQIILEEMP